MSKTINDIIQQLFNKVELLKTDENTGELLEIWKLIEDLKATITVEENERKSVLQQKLKEISYLL